MKINNEDLVQDDNLLNAKEPEEIQRAMKEVSKKELIQ